MKEPTSLLGRLDGRSFCGEEDQKKINISRFGGKIAIPKDKNLNVSIRDLQVCGYCSGPSILVTQLWSTYESSFYRILYVTCCLSAIREEYTTKNILNESRNQTEVTNKVLCSLSNASAWRVFRLIFRSSELESKDMDGLNKASNDFPQNNFHELPRSVPDQQQFTGDWLSDFLASTDTQPAIDNITDKRCDVAKKKPYNEDECYLKLPNSYETQLVDNGDSKFVLDCIKIVFEEGVSSVLLDPLTTRAEFLAAEYEKRQKEGIEELEDKEDLKMFQLKASSKNSMNNESCEWDEEHYENGEEEEKILRKFHKEVSKYPSQIIRYQFGGSPLWLTTDWMKSNSSSSNHFNIPKCPYCLSSRIFEFQLMPNLLSCLHLRTQSEILNQFIDRSNWGIIAIFSCARDCFNQLSNPFFLELYEEFLIVTPEL